MSSSVSFKCTGALRSLAIFPLFLLHLAVLPWQFNEQSDFAIAFTGHDRLSTTGVNQHGSTLLFC